MHTAQLGCFAVTAGEPPGHTIAGAKRAARWFEVLGILLCGMLYWVAKPKCPVGSDVGLGTLRHVAALLGRPLTLQPMSSHRSSQYLQAQRCSRPARGVLQRPVG